MVLYSILIKLGTHETEMCLIKIYSKVLKGKHFIITGFVDIVHHPEL
jgi:hypothetical protein